MSAYVPAPAFGDVIGPWHSWFAWYPSSTYDGRVVWMRWVRRRRIQSKDWLDGPLLMWWQIAVTE